MGKSCGNDSNCGNQTGACRKWCDLTGPPTSDDLTCTDASSCTKTPSKCTGWSPGCTKCGIWAPFFESQYYLTTNGRTNPTLAMQPGEVQRWRLLNAAAGVTLVVAVKGVELGAGFSAVSQRGSEHRDEISSDGFEKNDAGGTLGGISSGQDILASIALKPTSSISKPGSTIDKDGKSSEIVTTGRHDPCVGLRATPIAEAMVALVLMDHYLRHRAQNADVQSVTPVVTD